MKTIVELMTKSPIVIPVANEIQKTIEQFLELGITSAPVLDNYGKLAGMITEINLITAYFRAETKKDGKNKLVHHPDLLDPIETISETDSISETVKKMVKSKNHRIVVLDKYDKVIGIVSPKDVLKAVTGNLNKMTKGQRELQEAKESVKAISSQLENAQQVIAKLQGYLQEAPYMIHSVNEKGVIILTNAKIESTLGYAPGELEGKTIYDLYTKDHAEEARIGLKRLVKEGRMDPILTSMKKKNGDAVPVETISTALTNQKGEFIGTITMSRTVTNEMLKSLADAFSEPPPYR
jgi:PAS domain S-box-containing protein